MLQNVEIEIASFTDGIWQKRSCCYLSFHAQYVEIVPNLASYP